MATYAGRYSEDLQDRHGNGYRNALVAVETLAGAAVTLYADRAKTAYTPASGLEANEIKADSRGNLIFYADPGNYQIVVTPVGGSTLAAFPISVLPDPLEPDASEGALQAEEAARIAGDAALSDAITDLDGAKLAKASNLGDLEDVAEARDILGLGDAATQDAADLPVSTALEPVFAAVYYVSKAALDASATPGAVVQAVIDFAYSLGGGEVRIPPPTDGPWTLERNGLGANLQGQSIYLRANVALKGPGRGIPCFVMDDTNPLAVGDRYWPIRIGLNDQTADNCSVEEIYLDMEALKAVSGGGMYGIAARHSNGQQALHSDNVTIRRNQVIGGDIPIGCTKDGNYANAKVEPRLSQQYANWMVEYNIVRRNVNKAIEFAETNGGTAQYNIVDEVNDAVQAIHACRNITFRRNRGTFTASGVNITMGIQDFLVEDNDLEAHPDSPTPIGRGAMVFRVEDQATDSITARGVVRGNRFADAYKDGANVLNIQTRTLTPSLVVEDVTFEDNFFDGNVSLHDSFAVTQKTTLRRIHWGKGNKVTGSIVINLTNTLYAEIGRSRYNLPTLWQAPSAPAAWTANQMRATTFELEEFATRRYLLFTLGVQSGNIEAGIVRMTGELSWEKVATTGVIACPAAGDLQLDLGAQTPLRPGRYAIFFWADNAVVTMPLLTLSPALGLKLLGVLGSLVGGVPATGAFSNWSSRSMAIAASRETF